MKKNRTIFAKRETLNRDWYIVNAAEKVLGRLATKVATYLRGKHKPCFTPNVDCGDFIIITNADKVRFTGKKEKQKIYFTHSGYPHGQKLLNLEVMMAEDPAQVIRLAVAGMLPKNRLGRQMIKKLKIYCGAKHPHTEQKIKELEV
ncbi:50S ribosomal protein L13 [Candidatus Saganbacteria bacterium]|nr:50S ribosomal protein L13 [Candidatus Saganbacteria bacterium]